MGKKNMYKMLTDDELYAILQSDKNAESEFYRRYKIKVKWILKNYRLNSLEREDLIQEGMIGLFQAIQTYNPNKGARFSTYSNTCIRNRIINSLHSLWKYKKKIDEKMDIEDIISKHNPEQETIKNAFSENLRLEIEHLKPLEKQVLEGYIHRKSYKTIGEELSISSKKVDNILVKIKSKLAESIGKDILYRDGSPIEISKLIDNR